MFCLAIKVSLEIPLTIIFLTIYFSDASLTYLATHDILVASILKKDMLKYKFYLHKEIIDKPLTIFRKGFVSQFVQTI